MNTGAPLHIETIEQPAGAAARDAIYAFWLRQFGDLDRGAAAQRLSRVLAAARDEDGAIVATCSAVPARVAALGGQTLLVYRSLFTPAHAGTGNWLSLVGRAWEIVERRQRDGDYPACIGLLVPVDHAIAEANPSAVWPDSGLMHAGFGQRGTALRVRYFDNARLSLGEPA